MKIPISYFFILACCFSFTAECAPQTKYKLYCMYTPKFETLYTQYFFPSLKDDFELSVNEYPQDCPTGIFRSDGWDRVMLYKLELLQKAILENWNDRVFFYSDVDIIFIKPILEISLNHLAEHDFVVQQSWPRNKLCAGFFVMRGNEQTLKLINTAYTLLEEKICVDDQLAIQQVLDNLQPGEIDWKFLPAEQYANGRCALKDTEKHYSQDSEILLDDSIILFHASCCIGLENKYHFLDRVKELLLNKQSLIREL